MTRASSVQVAVEIASLEMQLASPTVFVQAVQRAIA
jgi:acyl-CoA thioester hydrolase